MAQPWDYIAKIVSLGDSGCGKSSLTVRLCEGRFSPHHDVTIGVEFGSRIVPVGPPASLELSINNPSKSASAQTPASASKQPPQKHMKLSLWDTAGQETYKSITRSYFRGASGALLVFDISRRNTFLSVTSWLHDLRQIAEEGIIVVLVGNKSDLAPASTVSDDQKESNKRSVTKEEAELWCKENGVMQYVETSAKSGEGVERAFLEVAERIYQNIEAGRYDLNDRRSGVKGPGAGGNSARVNLGMNDAARGKKAQQGWGSCC
ncbi:P-loop containing nucleoside triphosphate hydrolase protein [Massariosphaeria phaeospora]|uniref:P-loop containing nucleoside triphosphate hydrolase protein n=1 Tax=Massariosphaeria phaeospora TaxID=100035 RepID=A0A7C8ML61_9PLEO|nr:P-loop containing nucleoside triphosphate hydrolase protein [Massariosphaeria phaeospora]